MLKNLLRLTKPLLRSTLPNLRQSRSLFLPTLSRNFNASQGTNQGKIALAEHHKQIRLMQYLSTRMEMPQNVQKVDLKEWEEKGLLASMKEHSKGLEIYEATNVPDIPGANTPSGSWIQFKFPLGKDVALRDNFKRFFSEGIRVGRVLEIMDYLAGTVAYRYCKEDPKAKKVTMATAAVYDVEIFESQIRSTKDLLLTGYVCHVGKTSLEIRVDMSHSEDPQDQAGAAYFMFVARDAADYKKAVTLPQLSFEGESNPKKCLLRDEYGKRNKERRKSFAEKSLFKVPPSSDESIELHNLFKISLDPMAILNYLPVHKTQNEKLMLMHVQDKNRHGKVFGGYVMREATELAWVTAFLNSNGGYPQYVHIDDVIFVRPIPVGSITRFRSFLSYTEDSLMHVEVVADNLKDNNQEERVFEVNVTFSVDTTPKKVIPFTYSDGMLYLEGKRRVNNFYVA